MLSNKIRKPADTSWARNLEKFSLDGSHANPSTPMRSYSSSAVKAAAGIGVLALSATVFYRVRELLAAFLLFSVVFGVAIVAALILWLVNEAAHKAAGSLETRMARIAARRIVAPPQGHAAHILGSPRSN